MEIVFFRHGNALSLLESKTSSDGERPLSEKGAREVAFSAAALKKENFFPEIIISSPLRRARQTAGIISEFFKVRELFILDSLANSADIPAIAKSIMELSDGRNAIIIGHQPVLGIISRNMTRRDEIELKTAGYALINVKDAQKPEGELKSNFNPNPAVQPDFH